MVKSINFLDKLIFDYLGKENTAILLSQTGFFLDCELNDGVLWAQFNEENKITAVTSGENDRCVVFASEDADFEELSFDELCEKTNMKPAELSATLIKMEMFGLIKIYMNLFPIIFAED